MMNKKFILAVFCLIISAMAFAQVPQKMSYQAVVRGSDNNLVTNSEISVRISILQGSIDGEAVYTETHSATTNANGLLTIEIGDGTSNDDFSAISWANGPFFVKTETDVNGGNNYDIIGVSQLLTVPYAMYAQTAGNVPDVSGFLTEETDPTVPSWAKAETKPAYNYSEINNTPEIPAVPTNVSAFENDANYLQSESQTLADVTALDNSVNNSQIKNLADPTDAQDAVTKSYVDNLIAQLQEAINNIGGGQTTVSAPTVTTNSASNVTTTGATLSGNVTSDGNATVTARGFVYGTSANNLSQTVQSGSGTGSFTKTLTGLSYGTTYYYKAFAVSSAGSGYGEVLSFTTLTIYPPSVQTNSVTNITTTGATLSGDVTFDGNTTVTARGFMYGTDANNLTQSVQSGSGTGSFTKALTGLSSSTTYYYKAYATNTAGTAYGDVMTFTTLNDYYNDPTGYTNGHGYVDLGLPSGTKWATCNVGASTPTDYGNYYAWGETTTKSTYNWSTYRYCNGDNYTLTKYCNNSEYGNNGFTDNLTTLQASDDAATANWGSGWRMPTKTEMQELVDNCTVVQETRSGVNGRLFSGPNGNSIFLPAAGYRYDSSLYNAGSYGLYWSSSLYTDYLYYAWYLYFNSGNYYVDHDYRKYGFTVRPVCVSAQN